MKRTARHSLIKQLYASIPHGVPFDVETLADLKISAKLASQYVKSGWLVRLGHGVYAYPSDKLDAPACLLLLQQKSPGLHVGGKSALALHGVRHNLAFRETWILWGERRFLLPDWFTSRFRARFVHTRLFKWKPASLNAETISNPAGALENLKVSVPERAVLELLSEVGTHQDLEEARNLFDGLRNLRIDVLGRLLASCTSVKTVRLFLTWARETGVVDIDRLLKSHKIKTGSKSRWITRMKDGTLLTLKNG
jgi:hypothetical protein